jgi:hypothetical protein
MTWSPKRIIAAVLLVTAAPLVAQATDDNWDGLVRVNSERMELVYLAPEADFRPFTKVMLDPSMMAVEKNWLRDQRRRSTGLSGAVSERDVVRALEAGQRQFDEFFAEAFTKAGFEVVTAPGPEVVRISPGVFDIDVFAPDTSVGRNRSFSEDAGAATVIIEVRDSISNALLGRAVERRIAGDNGSWVRNSASNRADFDRLFRRWAEVSAEGLTELKALSPVNVSGAPLAR